MPHPSRERVNRQLIRQPCLDRAGCKMFRSNRSLREPSVREVLMYTTAICPYCVAAKNFLKSRGASYTEVRVDIDPARRAEMLARAKRSSVPQMFVGDVHIGGYEELVALDRAGELKPLLENPA